MKPPVQLLENGNTKTKKSAFLPIYLFSVFLKDSLGCSSKPSGRAESHDTIKVKILHLCCGSNIVCLAQMCGSLVCLLLFFVCPKQNPRCCEHSRIHNDKLVMPGAHCTSFSLGSLAFSCFTQCFPSCHLLNSEVYLMHSRRSPMPVSRLGLSRSS